MKRRNYGPLLILPTLLIIFMLLIFPVFYGFVFSLFKVRFLQPVGFTGISNFIDVVTNDVIVRSFIRAVVFSVSCAVLTIFAGTLFAYWINEREGAYAFSIQLVGLVPWVISMVVGSLLWKWILSGDFGLLNYLLDKAGLPRFRFFSDPKVAYGTLSFVVIWRTVGYSLVMILAGLKTVPKALLEASIVDGCGRISQFRNVILPTIKIPVLISLIVITLSNFNNVTVPLTLTAGGPGEATNMVSLELYRLGFVYNLFGPASALAVLVFVVNVILILTYSRLVKWNITD